MRTKKPAVVQQAASGKKAASDVQPAKVAAKSPTPLTTSSRAASPAPDLLLVCLQDPFDAVGDSSTIVRSEVPAADGNAAHSWTLEAVMEMNPPRFFEGWATRGHFTLDLSVNATVSPQAGTWSDTLRTTSGSGNCRVPITRDSNNKVRFPLASAVRHATEKPMPLLAKQRFLNADIAIELNGTSGLSAGAVAVVSSRNWTRLIAGTNAATQGLAFDGKWRNHLDENDGASTVPGAWAFAVMSRADYEKLCTQHEWTPYIL
jgi:hypothetical protein